MSTPLPPDSTPDDAPRAPRELATWTAWAGALLVVTAATLIGAVVSIHLDLTEISMVYILGILVVSTRWGLGPAVFASFSSVAAFDFFFVPPQFAFEIADARYFLTFVAMFVVGIVVSSLASRARSAALSASRRERRTLALYALSRDLSSARKKSQIAEAAARHVEEALEGKVLILLPGEDTRLTPVTGTGTLAAFDSHETEVASWVFANGQPAGFATDRHADGIGTYLPLRAGPVTHGVLGILAADARALRDPERWRALEAACDVVALALERVRMAKAAAESALRARSEEMRSALLSSVSHDLRTPLAAVTGAASALRDGNLPKDAQADLVQTIHEEMDRLNERVGKLLDMGRLHAGELLLRREWSSLEEITGAALRRLEKRMSGRTVTTSFPAELPLVRVDETLLETVVVNLVENALKHTPPASPIEISGAATTDHVLLRVMDRGPGLPAGMEERVFEKFVRAPDAGQREGAGLGLAICRGIVEGHGGRITARPREGGGACFEVALPREMQPAMEQEAT